MVYALLVICLYIRDILFINISVANLLSLIDINIVYIFI